LSIVVKFQEAEELIWDSSLEILFSFWGKRIEWWILRSGSRDPGVLPSGNDRTANLDVYKVAVQAHQVHLSPEARTLLRHFSM